MRSFGQCILCLFNNFKVQALNITKSFWLLVTSKCTALYHNFLWSYIPLAHNNVHNALPDLLVALNLPHILQSIRSSSAYRNALSLLALQSSGNSGHSYDSSSCTKTPLKHKITHLSMTTQLRSSSYQAGPSTHQRFNVISEISSEVGCRSVFRLILF